MDVNLFVCSFVGLLVVLQVSVDSLNVSNAQQYQAVFGGRNYFVVSSQILRPRSPFAISVHVFEDPSSSPFQVSNRSLRFYASIKCRDDELTYHKQMVYWNTPQVIYFMTPNTILPNSYELHVKAVNDADQAIIFDERSLLKYDRRFVSVVFQTTRPIYCAGQTVQFRILVLEMNLLPFNDVLDVFLVDPDNFIVRRWLSAYTNNGVISLKFKLPRLAKNGVWKIQSKIDNQIDEKSIFVETFYKPLFEVIVSSPPYVTSSEYEVTATIYGLYPTQKHVRGNSTVSWLARKINETSNFTLVNTDTFFIKTRKHDLSLPIERLQTAFDDTTNVEVKIEASITEYMSGETVSGFSHTRIISPKVVLKFLPKPPLIFTPATYLHGHLVVMYQDNERVPLKLLSSTTLRVQMECDMAASVGKYVTEIKITAAPESDYDDTEFYDKLLRNILRRRYLESSVLPFRFEVPQEATRVRLKASFTNEDGEIEAEALVLKKYDDDDLYLKVWTASEDLLIGDYSAFHVKSNFKVDLLYVLILSKGIILRVSEHAVPASTSPLFTFSETVSADMAPWFHLIVYCISKTGRIQSDAILVPVDGFSRYKTTLQVNTGKDFRNEKVELIFSGAEGAFIGVQAVRSGVFHLQSGHEITRSRVVDSFLPFERNTRALVKVNWISRTGAKPKESLYYTSQGYALDTCSVFSFNSLTVFSNMKLSACPESKKCDENRSAEPCFTEECFYQTTSCNTQEYQNYYLNEESSQEEYFIKRVSWNSFIFDAEEGDWAFREIRRNDHASEEFEVISTPRTADEWYFSTFTMDMVHGFSTIENPVIFSSKRPLMAYVLGPHLCHRGEQLGLKLYIHNFDQNQMIVSVTLLASNDYKFVHVERDGIVSSYNARLTGGDHQILIFMASESEEEIHFPVKPTVERGLVDIQFHVSSQTGRESVSHSVHVLGEGASVNKHTSVWLDLKNRGLVLQFLDIVVEETPIIPYEVVRRYVFGSPAANLTISNSIIGPQIGEGMLDMNLILRRESKGALDLLFELHANIWSLHYLRYTNQLDWKDLKETLYECNTLYAEIIRYFHQDGWFCYWEKVAQSRPSVWLTSWAVRIFKDACYPDWEFQFWIDPTIFSRMFRWLLTQQSDNGSFHEAMQDRWYAFDKRFSHNATDKELIALTAHVLISLYSAVQTINSELKSSIVITCLRARMYLEKMLASIHDPHLISVVAYALLITSSPEQGNAFVMLQKHMRIDGAGLYYWARKPVQENLVTLENQKPYIRPRTYRDTDSSAVEATSWALLVHLIHDGVTPVAENIVQWLVSVKMTNNGFVSVIDTAVAYQALTEFVYRSRTLHITHIDVKIELMMSNVTQHRAHIGNRSTPAFHLNIPQVWGHVHLVGRGSGIAFVQMDVNYGVEDEQFVDTPRMAVFDLRVSEFYSPFRNKSMITVQTCLRYVAASPESSGAAVLEIQSPTGYNIIESEAIDLVKLGVHPNLRDSRVVEGKTYWFFDFIDKELRCFNHTIKRWYPVANMTLYRNALLYEITARERFIQVLINSTPLYILSICEVCGSYQCPYCPYYNSATTYTISKTLFIGLLLLNVSFLLNHEH